MLIFRATYAAFWVGIDGFSSNTVEQTGTLSECYRGSAYYSAWYEFYPAGMVSVNSISVKPGDMVSAEVQYLDSSQFSISITDSRGTQSYNTRATVSSAQESSAESIAEAPSSCSRY